jgi:signal transduction histidine kinase
MGKKILERIKLTAHSGGGEHYEDFITFSEGDKWFISIYSQIANNQSGCSGVQIVSQDITERKFLEEELNQYSNRLESLVKERTKALEEVQAQLIKQEKLAIMSQMASSVGHELRNPLAVINNTIYVLGKTIKVQDGQKNLSPNHWARG